MTGAGNHVIPNVHFRKVNGMTKGGHYRAMFRTWFDQAARKKRRSQNRKTKAAKMAPRPVAGLLRPVVHPPTQRYNMKLRLGKGFTLEELREAKISPKLAPTIGIAVDHRRRNKCAESLQANVNRLKLYKRYNMKLRLGKGFTLEELREAKISPKLAPTIGIAVDHRRRNKCAESLQANVNRLKLYKSKLLIFPNKSGKKGVKKGDTPKSELQNVAQNTLKEIIPVERPTLRVKARAITSDEKEASAFKTLKKERTNMKYDGAKRKKAAEAKAE
eukprot:CAMPEP_0183485722 /NCGR_PEP_ID=MMETSP0370-20130417/179573_1 /TAXON_ID=268820 /ORGANISM="Peridinium aciculiferum, Strain PAER-2" /LENGTH=273 /DNA_ID=CAMNT_0025679029 /DNA_START=75 /DNA_END=896 /DNA_ORIENTATION=+